MLLAACVTGLASSLSAATRPLGDVDGDGIVTVVDLAQQIAVARGQSTAAGATGEIFADVDRNGFVNDDDSAAIVRFILETDTPGLLPLATVRTTSPVAGETSVAVTREFVLHFTIPLALEAVITTHNPNDNTAGNLYATFGGSRLLTRAELSSDRKKASLFFLEPLPAGARIRVTFDPTGLKDLLDRELDGDGDGAAGGHATFDFDTLGITALTGTGVTGTVYGIQVGTNNATTVHPLGGVTITVDGAEQDLRTTTGSDGKFTLTPAPAGKFFVLIDGRTAGGTGGYYAFVGKAWEGVAGRLDTPVTPATTNTAAGDIYLPFIPTGTLQAVSATQSTSITFAPSVLQTNPGLAGVQVNVPANSLFADNGARGGQVGIAPVAPDRLPEPLPEGLDLSVVITIQTDGATNFDRPVPVRFPNLPDPVTGIKLPPGAKSALWSFDHDKGRWEIAGPMTVTADGNFVETDGGVGVLQPGWHGQQPGDQGDDGDTDDDDDDTDDDNKPDDDDDDDEDDPDDDDPNDDDDDIDGDGIPNGDDDDMDGDGFDNGEDIDMDGDGISNITDDDMDGDGVDNDDDPDQDGDGIPNDEDPYYGDGFPEDDDIDGDGTPNPGDLDMDGDDIPNDSDPDVDGDGVVNGQDADLCGGGAVITIQPGASLTTKGRNALRSILQIACQHQATVTRSGRTTTQQAQFMFTMAETNGAAFAKSQFNATGDLVIDTYIARKAAGDTGAQIQAAMRQRIIDLGSQNVDRHCSDTRETFDVSPTSIIWKPGFEVALAAAKTAGIIVDFSVPPAEPGYHIEVDL